MIQEEKPLKAGKKVLALLLTVCTIVSAVGAAIVWCAVQTKKHAAC